MHSQLNLLKQYSDQLVADPVTNDPNSILSQVAKECERLKEFLFLVFNKLDENYNAEEVINWYRRSTIKLADILWDASKSGNPFISQALIMVVGFIRHFEVDYPDLLQQKHSLSFFEVEEMRTSITAELQVIKVGLIQKKISITLIEQLLKAYSDLFSLTRYPALNYEDKKHADVFLPRLMSLSVDERDKDWNLRIRELLIKYNVNHLGIYKLLKSEHIKDAAFLNQYGEKYAFLNGKGSWLQDLELIPDIAYNSTIGHLKLKLRNNIKSMERQMPLQEDTYEHPRFALNLSVQDLNLLLVYLYRIGVLRYNTIKQAAIAFCLNISSKETKVISFRSITKTDHVARSKSALRVYRFLMRIADMLKADFNL